VLGCANGLFGRFIQAIHGDGALAAALSIDINVVVFFACFAGLSLMFSGLRQSIGDQRIRGVDIAVTAIFLGLVAVPIYPLSWIAVTGLSFYILLFARDNSDRVRGAVTLLALAVPMFWSRLLFQLFAKIILDIDATLVATVLDSSRVGNMVQFADGSGFMIVLAPCSSLANMSLAFLCWISVSQWVRHPWSKVDLLWSGLACLSVVAVNVTRISLMGLGQSYYSAIHNQWGDLVTNTIMLVLMVIFSVIGARREIFTRI
jgi:exosortase/archaeosortase family protein